MGQTSIEWTSTCHPDGTVTPGWTVNPIRFGLVGHYCQKISPGCANCYASRFQPRVGNPPFGGVTRSLPVLIDNGKSNAGMLWFDESKLRAVLRRRKPTKFFWCDMTDLFGVWVPFEWIDKCFAAMALTPQHTHQVLTKRPERMAEYLATRTPMDDSRRVDRMPQWYHIATAMLDAGAASMPRGAWDRAHEGMPDVSKPLPNVWLGTSVEDQQRADERIPHLLRCPAAVRFLSCEPLLGQIDFDTIEIQAAPGFFGSPLQWHHRGRCHEVAGIEYPTISWVIVGGESGPGARACEIAWIRSIVAQCRAAGVACFVKQLGSQPVFDGSIDEAAPLRDRKGGDPSEWPEDLRVREFPKERQ